AGDAHALFARERERLDLGHAGRDDDEVGLDERLHVVAAELPGDALDAGARVAELGRRALVGDGDLRAALQAELRDRQAGLARADDEHLVRPDPGDDVVVHVSALLPRQRTLSVASATSASMKLMIQKRTITFGSAQPLSSKWWWMGAILKTRLPVS